MAQTRRSTAEKGQGHSVRQEDRGLLGLQGNFVDWFQRKKHHCERCVLCFTFTQTTWRYQGEEARNVDQWSSSAPWQRSSPHGGCCQGCSEGIEEIDHLPYTPDLAPKLKKDLRGKKFDNDEEVKTAVMEHFADKGPDYFLKGIKLLVHRCEKFVEIKGDYG